MSQTAITLAFEQWKASQAVTGESVLLDEFVFANVPGLNTDKAIDRNEGLPPAAQIVHRQAVSRKGVVNENAVVHSVVLGADVGDFSFNWVGLINKASNTLAMIVHAPLQQKLKTKDGQQGNVLTRSFLMEYNGAQTETGINTPAETWQIDFTARMAGMDERQRLENIDLYGAAAFLGDGWLVAKSGSQFYVTAGAGYVRGLRAVLAANQNITVTTKPIKVWLDVCWVGAMASVWAVQSKVTVAANLADYEQNGVKHYVFALASIDANGTITDLRPRGTSGEQQANSDFVRKDQNLSDLKDKKQARENLELKSAALRDVTSSRYDTSLDRLMQVGDYGWGTVTGLAALKSIFDITCTAKYAALGAGAGTSATEGMPANSGNTRFSVDVDSIYTNQYWVTLRSSSQAYIGMLNTSTKTITWSQLYTTAYKPTAGDTGALPVSGGTLTGPLIVQQNGSGLTIKPDTQGNGIYYLIRDADNTDIAYFGRGSNSNNNVVLNNYKGGNNSLVLNADGSISITCTNGKNLSVTGQVVTSNYGNFDARYYMKAQSDAAYMPKTGAYTKAESDGRFQPKGSYGAPDTSGISGNVLWWKNTVTGVITMMGQTAGVANSGRVTFPFAFPAKCYGVVPTRNNPTGNGAAMQPYDVNTSGWNLRIAGGGTETVMWIAMGK